MFRLIGEGEGRLGEGRLGDGAAGLAGDGLGGEARGALGDGGRLGAAGDAVTLAGNGLGGKARGALGDGLAGEGTIGPFSTLPAMLLGQSVRSSGLVTSCAIDPSCIG